MVNASKMNWLRNKSPIGAHLLGNGARTSFLSTDKECDPQACYDSFKQHWQQALKIIKRSQQLPNQDDVLSVVNHMEQMGVLLQYDVKKIDPMHMISNNSTCLEYLIEENILDNLFEWSIRTGKYGDAVKFEQLKLYEMLICQLRHVLLVQNTFFQPLLKILHSCLKEMFPKEIEETLLNLLYQLCIILMQNSDLIELFFLSNFEKSKFIIFALLIPFVHREGNIGMRARDSLLLCMTLTKKHRKIRKYVAESNICALMASGLGGLYSDLPHTLDDIQVPDWHRLTPDDVNDIKILSTFVTSLEFCNSVSQLAHASIVQQLQEYIHMGFLTPVIVPALLQEVPDEEIAVTAYLELMLRTVTNPGLLLPVLKFLLLDKLEEKSILEVVMKRINSTNTQVSLVSLALFATLVDLNCEDVMLELIFHHLQPCLHMMISQRKTCSLIDLHCKSAEKFLHLAPTCSEICPVIPTNDGRVINWNHYGSQSSLFGNYHAYLCDARNKIHACHVACVPWAHSYNGCDINDSTDDALTSLPSLGESSGYESLKLKHDNEEPPWQVSHNQPQGRIGVHLSNANAALNSTSGNVGPFLTILLDKLKSMLSNSFYVNLHLTGLISRLAVYSQPLLRTYLLDHGLILQPSVPSLFQIVGSLKQQIDEFMFRQPDRAGMIQYAKQFLLDRETRLVNFARRNALDADPLATTHIGINQSHSSEQDQFQRNSSKRRSFTQSLSSFSSMFVRKQNSLDANLPMQSHAHMNEVKQQALYAQFNDAQRVAVCAVLLDEWVKELAALAQEHSINQLAMLMN